MMPFFPKKSLGQNFLKFPEIAQKIVRAGDIKENDTVVEIGPGFGILTELLAEKAKKVIAVELDVRLEPELKKKLAAFLGLKKIELVFQDALKFSPPKTPYKLIANIPYSITSPLINHFLKEQFLGDGNPPALCVLMVQKEVAKKICAKPPDMNMLALNCQMFAKPKYLFTVGKGVFKPQPKVDSAVIALETLKQPLITDPEKLKAFFEIISSAFSQKRKTLGRSLKEIYGPRTPAILQNAGIDSKRRPETLIIEEWCLLMQTN